VTPEKLKSIFQKYAALFVDEPQKLRDGGYDDAFYTLTHGEREAHVAWMCQEAQKFVDQMRIEKAMRWLGFVQGYLWARSMRTLEELKTDSMPDPVAADYEKQKAGNTPSPEEAQ
jgi:glycyl-tRNA synthetase beta subunit